MYIGTALQFDQFDFTEVVCLFLHFSDIPTYKKLFTNSCPKFISPVPPDYDALPDNYTKVNRNKNNTAITVIITTTNIYIYMQFPSDHQCNVFMKELEPQLMVPVIRRLVDCCIVINTMYIVYFVYSQLLEILYYNACS